MQRLSQFWQELKRRNVVRRNAVYAGAAFVILELVSIVEEPMNLPEWTLSLVIVLLCIGFIVSVIISWIYDFNPEGGLVKTKPVHKVKNEDKKDVSSTWRIASYLSFVVIFGLIVLNIIPRNSRSDVGEILDKSIAVLPFINDSPDKENEHFINGIMEDLLINLQTVAELRVPGRTSVEQYRNNPKPIPEIASELNVSYIIEGSGQRYGNKIRLRVQLVEGKTDKHLWADSYDEEIKKPEDIFRIQSKIAKTIAAELQAIITPEETQLIEKTPTTSLTAYDFYQRGREEYNKNNDERAEDLYRKALEYDSTFALAYVGLAQVYGSKYFWETFFTENFMDSMLILADIALSFDDQLAEAYVIRGDHYRAYNENEQAIEEYDKAIKFNPNHWQAYWRKGSFYAQIDLVKTIDNYQKAASLHRGTNLPEMYRRISTRYTHAGFKEKSYYYAKEALKLDDDSSAHYSLLAEIEGLNSNFEKAIEFWEKSYASDSTNRWVIGLLGVDHMYLGHYKESLKYYIKYEKRSKALGFLGGGIWLNRIGYAYWVNGFKEEAEYYFNRVLEFHNQMNEVGRSRQNPRNFFDLAGLYAFRGDKDKAYEYLRLFNQGTYGSLWMIREIKNDPMFNSIRGEPEFQQIVRDYEEKYQTEHERVRIWLEENDMLY